MKAGMQLVLDPNRPFLAQLEEAAEQDPEIAKFLEREIYNDPEIMAEWDPLTFLMSRSSVQISPSPPPAAPREDKIPRLPPPSIVPLSDAEFWAGLLEVKTVLDGLKPFVWEEADWAKQTARTQEAIGTVGKWALARCFGLVLNYWHHSAPIPGETLLHQFKRARISLIPDCTSVLMRIDTDINNGFIIENDPEMAEFARDTFPTACGACETILQIALIRRIQADNKRSEEG